MNRTFYFEGSDSSQKKERDAVLTWIVQTVLRVNDGTCTFCFSRRVAQGPKDECPKSNFENALFLTQSLTETLPEITFPT